MEWEINKILSIVCFDKIVIYNFMSYREIFFRKIVIFWIVYKR